MGRETGFRPAGDALAMVVAGRFGVTAGRLYEDPMMIEPLRFGLTELDEDLFQGPDQIVLLDLALPEGQRQAVGLVRGTELEDIGLAAAGPALVPVAQAPAQVVPVEA